MDKQIKVVELENIEDLELLVQGDVIQRKDISRSFNDWETVAFHQVNKVGHYELLFPAFFAREEYLIVDRIRKSIIQVVEGGIIYDRYHCVIEAVSQSDPRYKNLNKTLLMAGLR